jgi:hypothetical protein
MNATDEQKLAALAVLQGASTVPAAAGLTDSILSAAEVARLTNLTPRSLRTYARRGFLKPAVFCGGKRSWGYSARSVQEFIDGALARGAEVRAC